MTKGKETGSLSHRWLERLKRVESPDVTFVAENFPIVMKSARGMAVRDVENERYLDFTACFGVMALGHRSPKVANAIRRQASRLIHGMGDVHPSQEKIVLLEKLARLSPYANPKTVLSLTGSEAVETALKTAMLVTGRQKFLSFDGAYHGLLMGSMNLIGMPFFTQGFEAWVRERARVLPYPYGGVRPGLGKLPSISELMTREKSLPENEVLALLEDALKENVYAALVMEVIQGRGGEREFSPDFVKNAAALCKRYGTLLIFDEVFTGFGRTGKMFALEHVGVVPDLLCLGKSLAGGFPLSACVSELFDVWGKSGGEARHTSTFLGHPFACGIARTTLNEIELLLPRFQQELGPIAKVTESFIENCVQGGLADVAPFVLRGQGFMQGLWFYKNPAGFAAWLMEELLKSGFIVLPSGADAKTLSLSPPLIATREHFLKLYRALHEILNRIPKSMRALP